MARKRKRTRIAHAEVVRLSRGVNQAELARQAQVSVAYVGRLEGGGAAPGIDLVDRLARALGVRMSDLLPSSGPTDTSST